MASIDDKKLIQQPSELKDSTEQHSLAHNHTSAESVTRVVGIGASAGGLDALERFFQNTPLNSGLAFVIVQHLAPDFNSLMDELLARHTELPIYEVKDGMQVAPNTIYLLPPRSNMIYINGQLQLSERQNTDGLNLPINIFFRSLAQGMGAQAIGVILSGTGSDGSLGAQELQQAGGLIVAQEPTTALFDGMPRNAINTQAVHIVASPEDISHEIISHVTTQSLNAGLSPLPPLMNDDAVGHANAVDDADSINSTDPDRAYLTEENGLSIILALLQSHFQIDFTQYKPETVLRRVSRRFQMNRLQDVAAYLQLLQTNQSELDTLYRDLLIDVTLFFRDAAAFELLKPIIQKMVTDASLDDDIRVWVAGCATGEEAYSLAMLFAEAIASHPHPVQVQIFATDAHPESVAIASNGHYSAECAAGMPVEFVEKYLTPVDNTENDDNITDSFVVNDLIRRMIVFAQHNLLQDPPFTRLSLVTCRNVLIYFKPHAQERILSQFFFGLNSGGTLFLGPSEQVGRLKDEFSVESRRWRIFTKQSAKHLPLTSSYPQNRRMSRPAVIVPRQAESAAKLNLYESLLDTQMPPGLLLNEQQELVRTFGDAGKYLRITGIPSYQIMDLVDVEFGTALRAGFHRSMQDKKPVIYTGIRVPKNPHAQNETVGFRTHAVDTNNLGVEDSGKSGAGVDTDSFVRLRVMVTPLLGSKLDQNYFLVSLTEVADVSSSPPGTLLRTLAESTVDGTAAIQASESNDQGEEGKDRAGLTELHRNILTDDASAYVHADLDQASRDQVALLKKELLDTREYLQTTIEELETTNEEVQSTNEELIASNEELQSTNEELHSVNEELYTVNSEYQRKIDELQLVTDDMANLQNSTQIATLFLDRDLRVRHYTPAMTEILHLLPQDIERPVDHLRPDIDLEHKTFVGYLQTVLYDESPIEIEVMHKESIRLLLRILPYYTYENKADGIVLTFTDITSTHDAEMALSAQQKMAQQIIAHSPIHLDMYDVRGRRTITLGKDLREKLGYTKAEIQQMPERLIDAIGHPDEHRTTAEHSVENALLAPDDYISRELRLRHKDGSWRWFLRTKWVHEQNPDGTPRLLARTTVDITAHRQMAEDLVSQEKLFASIAEVSPSYIYLFDEQAEEFVYANRDIKVDLGYSAAEIAAMPSSVSASLAHPDDMAKMPEYYERLEATAEGEVLSVDVRLRHKDGRWQWYTHHEIVYERDANNKTKLVIGTAVDTTSQHHAEEELRARESRYRNLFENSVDAIYLIDMAGNIIDANVQASRELGYSYAELITFNVSDLNLNLDKEALLERYHALPFGHYIESDSVHLRKDNSYFPVEARGVKIKREDQEYMLVTVRNISDWRESQEIAPLPIARTTPRLREQRMQLLYEITSHIATDVEIQLSEALRLAASALNSQYAAIGRIDDDMYLVRHLFASGSEMEMGQALPLDETYCSIILEQGDDVLVINQMADSGFADRACYKRMGFESYIGTTIKVNGKAYGNVCFFGEKPKSPAYTKADEDFVRLLSGWIGFAIERLRVDSAHAVQGVSLESTNAELVRSNQDLDTFVYIASHDLKEPLRGINQYAQFLEEDYGHKLDDEGIHMLTALREQSSRAEQLIEDLRFYSRIGRSSLGLEEINLNELIQGVLAQIRARLSENDVQIVVAENLPLIFYNHARLSTVFQNLIVNAIKYNTNQKKRVEIGISYAGPPPEVAHDFNRSDLPTEDLGNIDIDLLSQLSYGAKEANSPLSMPWLPEGEPILSVRDNGIGIADRNVARIFGMFKRLHGNGEYGGGTGAGLPIVRRILERNGGHIWVESTVGEGTQFNFTLGRVPAPEE